jgi:hypothetical protein
VSQLNAGGFNEAGSPPTASPDPGAPASARAGGPDPRADAEGPCTMAARVAMVAARAGTTVRPG